MNEAVSTTSKKVVGRFAPSPTGRMHAGNIFAALVAWLLAKSQNGEMVLRIEDLDRERSKQAYIDDVQHDLERLELTWDQGPYFQHDRDAAYQSAFEALQGRGLTYPCFCSRADLHAASAPHRGEKLVYPGTCRTLTPAQIAKRSQTKKPAIRLITPDSTVSLHDMIQGEYSQNLASECGVDLLSSTPEQIYLQQLLGLPECSYAHVPLLVAQKDRRLSKRDKDASIDVLMRDYKSAEAVIGHIAYITGIVEFDEPASPADLLSIFNLEKIAEKWRGLIQIQWR